MARESGSGDLRHVEGRNPVLEALRGPRSIERLFIADGAVRSGVIADIISLASSADVPISEVPREDIDEMSLTSAHQGVIATVSPYRYSSMEELLPGAPEGGEALLLVLDGVEDPRNFGALIRVADACGAGGVVATRRRSSPLSAVVASASAGAVEHVRIARVSNLNAAIRSMKEKDVWVAALVLGGEGKGLSRLVGENCDLLVRLPMEGRVSSLNVASAGAVILYEAVRQRA